MMIIIAEVYLLNIYKHTYFLTFTSKTFFLVNQMIMRQTYVKKDK